MWKKWAFSPCKLSLSAPLPPHFPKTTAGRAPFFLVYKELFIIPCISRTSGNCLEKGINLLCALKQSGKMNAPCTDHPPNKPMQEASYISSSPLWIYLILRYAATGNSRLFRAVYLRTPLSMVIHLPLIRPTTIKSTAGNRPRKSNTVNPSSNAAANTCTTPPITNRISRPIAINSYSLKRLFKEYKNWAKIHGSALKRHISL